MHELDFKIQELWQRKGTPHFTEHWQAMERTIETAWQDGELLDQERNRLRDALFAMLTKAA